MRRVTVGRDVLFVLDANYRNTGESRPAKVVRTFAGHEIDQRANLCVFLDGTNDCLRDDFVAAATIPFVWRTSVPYSKEMLPGTWHWHTDEPDYQPDFPEAQVVQGNNNAQAASGGTASVNIH